MSEAETPNTIEAWVAVQNLASNAGITVEAHTSTGLASPSSLTLPWAAVQGFTLSNSFGLLDCSIILKNPGGTDSVVKVTVYSLFSLEAHVVQRGMPAALYVKSTSSFPANVQLQALMIGDVESDPEGLRERIRAVADGDQAGD